MKRYVLAHDVGTSGNKATLFTVDGELIGSKTYPYDTRYFNNNWAEQNPNDWWEAVCHSTRELVQDIDVSEIAAVSFSGQMMGCLCVDKDGTPLRDAIIYCDQRAQTECQDILKQIDPKDFYHIVGHRANESYSLEKLMWVKNNEPEIYKKTYKMLHAKDYIVFKHTGNMMTDHSDASGTNAFDLNNFSWSEKIIDVAGIDGEMLPELKKSIDVAGTVTTKAAQETGLKEGTPVVVGGGDGSCAGIGVGCIKTGLAYNYLGSSSWSALMVDKPVYDEKMRVMNWAHAIPYTLQPSGTMQTAGASYNWLKNEICALEVKEAGERGISPYDVINDTISQSVPGANGILFLPYLLGERTPRWNADAKGAFIGLNLSHKRADVLRAVMEGITYNLEIILRIFRQHVEIDTITVIGGGAKGDIWRQMMADIYHAKILKPNYLEEATSMGAAIIGGVGVGAFQDFSVVDRFIKIESEQIPNEENRRQYLKMMPIFDDCYYALEDIYKKLAKI